MSSVKFERVVTDLKPKAFLKQYLKEVKPNRVLSVIPGQEVTLELPKDGNFVLTFVGEMPERYSITEGVLSIQMTNSALFLVVAGGAEDLSRVEVVSAL